MCSIIFKNNAHPQFQLVLTHVDVLVNLKTDVKVTFFGFLGKQIKLVKNLLGIFLMICKKFLNYKETVQPDIF